MQDIMTLFVYHIQNVDFYLLDMLNDKVYS